MTQRRKFPEAKYANADDFADSYFEELARASRGIDRAAVARAAEMLQTTMVRRKTIFALGNGGSASIANHLLCDFNKGIQTDTRLRPKVVSLAVAPELMLAVGNDIGFEDVFRFQAATWCDSGDLLLAISSSGRSPNVVKALQWAKENDVATIALTGFEGGAAREIADCSIHVDNNNYGIVEDLHQSIIHLLAQYIRQDQMSADLVSTRIF